MVADQELVNQTRLGGQLFLSVIDWRAHRACVDARVPVPADPQALVTFRGDTLMVLVQDIVGDKAVAVVRKYRVDTRRCEWREG